MTTLALRASGLPLAFLCGGSVRTDGAADGLDINETNDAAAMGTAAHQGLAVMVETGRVDWAGVPELARKHGVDVGELRMLLGNGAKLWPSVKDSFPDASTEVAFRAESETVILTGHVDGISIRGNVARILDHKTGRLASNYSQQALGYCALVLLQYPELEQATCAVLWIRDLEVEQHTMARAELPAWLERLESEVVEWSGQYRPGNHCDHCPRRYVCPARNAMMRADLAILLDTDVEQLGASSSLATASPDRVLEVTERLARFEKMNARWRAALRAHVERHGDIVGTEHRLTLQAVERRRLDVIQTFPVLEAAGFDAEDFAQVVEISASKAEGIVAKRAEKRKGAAAVRELQAQLAAAGAVQTFTTTSLVVRRV